jgi:hypothetical protein
MITTTNIRNIPVKNYTVLKLNPTKEAEIHFQTPEPEYKPDSAFERILKEKMRE